LTNIIEKVFEKLGSFQLDSFLPSVRNPYLIIDLLDEFFIAFVARKAVKVLCVLVSGFDLDSSTFLVPFLFLCQQESLPFTF